MSCEENDKYSLEDLLPRIQETFSEWNLKVNNSKTEYVDIYLSENTTERGKENWRSTKILGSRLDTSVDIQCRINMGSVAFKRFKEMWNNNKHITTTTNVRVY